MSKNCTSTDSTAMIGMRALTGIKDFLKIENEIFVGEFPMYSNLFDDRSDAKEDDNNTNRCVVDEIDKEED
jgi:hypothetical protein